MPFLFRIALASTFVAFSTFLIGCMTHSVFVEFHCVKVANISSQGNITGEEALQHTCIEWEHRGGIQSPSCFPEDAIVLSKSGPKPMCELMLGDEILGFDHTSNISVFSSVRAWLHRHPEVEVLMTKIEAEHVSVVTSSKHLVAVQDAKTYKFADELIPKNDILVTQECKGAAVQKVSGHMAKGLFAPLTHTSNFYVTGAGNTSAVLAHSFAQVENPQRFERVFHKLLDLGEYFLPTLSDVIVTRTSDTAYIHPLAKMLMWILRIPTAQEIVTRRLKSGPKPDKGLFNPDDPDDDDDGDDRGDDNGSFWSIIQDIYLSLYYGAEYRDLRVLLAAVHTLPPFMLSESTALGSPMPKVFPRTATKAKDPELIARFWVIWGLVTLCSVSCFFYNICKQRRMHR